MSWTWWPMVALRPAVDERRHVLAFGREAGFAPGVREAGKSGRLRHPGRRGTRGWQALDVIEISGEMGVDAGVDELGSARGQSPVSRRR